MKQAQTMRRRRCAHGRRLHRRVLGRLQHQALYRLAVRLQLRTTSVRPTRIPTTRTSFCTSTSSNRHLGRGGVFPAPMRPPHVAGTAGAAFSNRIGDSAAMKYVLRKIRVLPGGSLDRRHPQLHGAPPHAGRSCQYDVCPGPGEAVARSTEGDESDLWLHQRQSPAPIRHVPLEHRARQPRAVVLALPGAGDHRDRPGLPVDPVAHRPGRHHQLRRRHHPWNHGRLEAGLQVRQHLAPRAALPGFLPRFLAEVSR